MKKNFSFLLATFTTFACVQTAHCQTDGQEKIIPINDIRRLGIIKYDYSTSGHNLNEVMIDRSLSLKPAYMEGKDTNELYQIHFFKMYEGKLKNYQMGYSNAGEFDKASYKWVTDSIVSVTLINSITNERRSLKLAQHGDTTAILKESFEEKK